jgi:CRP/FNR family transcriptional regulator, dissimilatory nitrate respiration regulator
MQAEDRELLRHHHLFAALTDAQFQAVYGASHVLELLPLQTLFQRGDLARHFFVVLEGQVKLCLLSRGGDEKLVDVVGPGQGFAEAVMFMAMPVFPVTAIATDRARVAALPNDRFQSLLRESGETCLRLLADLSRRLHGQLRQIESLALENATNRVVNHLVDLAGGQSQDGAIVTLEESKQQVASRLAIKPETLSRSLRALTDAGLVEVQGRAIRIPDLARLRHWH